MSQCGPPRDPSVCVWGGDECMHHQKEIGNIETIKNSPSLFPTPLCFFNAHQ